MLLALEPMPAQLVLPDSSELVLVPLAQPDVLNVQPPMSAQDAEATSFWPLPLTPVLPSTDVKKLPMKREKNAKPAEMDSDFSPMENALLVPETLKLVKELELIKLS